MLIICRLRIYSYIMMSQVYVDWQNLPEICFVCNNCWRYVFCIQLVDHSYNTLLLSYIIRKYCNHKIFKFRICIRNIRFKHSWSHLIKITMTSVYYALMIACTYVWIFSNSKTKIAKNKIFYNIGSPYYL